MRARLVLIATLAAAAVAGCSTPAPATVDLAAQSEAQIVARYPACASHVTRHDNFAECVVNKQWIAVYAMGSASEAEKFVETVKALHPTGQVSVDGVYVWAVE